jgi:hypothetical protein
MVNVWKLIVVVAMSLCLMGCRNQPVEETVPPTEQNSATAPSESISATTNETVYEDIGFEGDVLVESTEATSATEPEMETNASFVTEPETEPQETTGQNAIPDNTDTGDFLEPPAEGSDGVL